MSQQSLKQQSCRDASDTTGTYNEDWIKTFEEAGITTGTFSEECFSIQKNKALLVIMHNGMYQVGIQAHLLMLINQWHN